MPDADRSPPPAELLPLTIRVVANHADLLRAVAVRSDAYGRHVPSLAAKLAEPEPCDLDGSAVVLIADAKNDGSAVGTVRLQLNQRGPLDLERSVDLPPPYRG